VIDSRSDFVFIEDGVLLRQVEQRLILGFFGYIVLPFFPQILPITKPIRLKVNRLDGFGV